MANCGSSDDRIEQIELLEQSGQKKRPKGKMAVGRSTDLAPTSQTMTYRRRRIAAGKRNRRNVESAGAKNVEKSVPSFESKVSESDINEKRLSSRNLRNEYRKLEGYYENIRGEFEKLNAVSQQREAEYWELRTEYQKLSHVLREAEETKQELLTRNRTLEEKNARAYEDVTLLKNVTYCLNVELDRYQEMVDRNVGEHKSQSSRIQANLPGNETTQAMVAWGAVDFHALAPLLNAYQENLTEKRALLENYKQEIVGFAGRCKEIVRENENMRIELEELTSKCNRYAQEMNALSESVSLVRKRDDMETIEKIRGKVNLEKDFGVETRKADVGCQTTAVSANMSDRQDNPIEESKRLIEKAETPRKDARELAAITAERNHLKSLTVVLRKSLKRARREMKSMQSSVNLLQNSRDSYKKQLIKTLGYCEILFGEYERVIAEREKLVDVLREREKENADVDRLGKSIARRVDDLRSYLTIVERVAKERVADMEKRLGMQKSRLRRVRRRYRSQLENLTSLIKEKDRVIRERAKNTRSEDMERSSTPS